MRDGLLGLHQPLSNHLQEGEIKPDFSLLPCGWSLETAAFTRKKIKTDQQKCRQISGLTLRMLLMGMSVKVPAGVVGAGAAAAAAVGAAATACQ